MKMTAFWDIAPYTLVEVDRRFRSAYCIIKAVIMEAVHTSETSVNFYEVTRRSIPEGCHLESLHCFSMAHKTLLNGIHEIIK
jgi:hypothetical protein